MRVRGVPDLGLKVGFQPKWGREKRGRGWVFRGIYRGGEGAKRGVLVGIGLGLHGVRGRRTWWRMVEGRGKPDLAGRLAELCCQIGQKEREILV